MRTPNLITALAVISLLISANRGITQETEPSKSLRAMSFNIRLGVADDGANHWNNRKEIVAKTIANFDADIVGTQETWDFQAEFLDETLTDYTYVGRSRQNDNKGEQCGIFFRSSRFDKLIEGHFWLSETPDEPGSKSWDSSLPRMATWLKLWDRENKRSFYVINTHFDHRGKTARSESAKLIRKFIRTLPDSSSVIVTGDFNASEGWICALPVTVRQNGRQQVAGRRYVSSGHARERQRRRNLQCVQRKQNRRSDRLDCVYSRF